MGSTRVSDIVTPTVFVPYIEEQTVHKNALIQAGIVIPDPRIDILARSGGKTVNMPFFADLTGDDEVLDSGTGATDSSLTPGAIGTATDIACLFMRGKAWGSEDIAAAVAGSDPMAAIGNMIATFWNRREQALLLAILKGVFADNAVNDSSDLISDISIADGSNAQDSNLIGTGAVIDACAKLGDMSDRLTAMAMHSVCYTRLQKNDQIDFIPDSEGRLTIPTYLGKRVIVDDTCPTVTGATSGAKYATYLFGSGAIGRGEGSPKVPFETDRDSLAGVDLMIHRRHFILHPRGIAFSAAAASISAQSPSNTEVVSQGFWNRVYQKKNIRLVRLITNG